MKNKSRQIIEKRPYLVRDTLTFKGEAFGCLLRRKERILLGEEETLVNVHPVIAERALLRVNFNRWGDSMVMSCWVRRGDNNVRQL